VVDPHRVNWATKFAMETVKLTNRFDIECWKLYDPNIMDYGGIYSEYKYGITFKLFPAKKVVVKYISIPLLKELRKRIKNKEKIIVHFQSVHNEMLYLIALLSRGVPLVAQQRGPNNPPIWTFKFRKNPLYILYSIIDNFLIKNFDFIFASSIGEFEYVKKKLGPERVMHQKGGGFDFDNYVPKSKEEARKELGLSLNKNIMVHIGRFTKLKGVDVIIEVYKKLKKKYDDIEMIFIGGNKTEPLYEDVVQSGATVKERISKDEVIKYINAADVHLLPTEDKKWIPFGDIPTSLVESLSMNQPVVSPMLLHFAGTERERKKLGIITKNREDVLKAI